jgi:two-component system, chemotaxis family, CheB/CheR fusion protein
VLGLFYYALEPNGLLLVDAHDELDIADLFTRDADHPEILRRANGPRDSLRVLAGFKSFARGGRLGGGASRVAEHFDTATIFRHAAERYAPPSVLIDREDRVVHFSAGAARYVRIPGGELSLDVLKLVPEVIASKLRSGLQHARREQRAWCSDPFVVLVDNRARSLVLRVDPYRSGSGHTNFWLVVFDDAVALDLAQPAGGDGQRSEQLRNLQAELAAVRGQLAVISADSQRVAADRDMQHNQERDLHQALEELEGTREELQAINEELISVDAESRHRIAALTDVSQELQHLLESSGYATLLLDEQLQIVRFTPLAAALLGLRDRDIRRPLADLKHHLRYEGMVDELRKVAQKTQDFEAEIESDDGRWFLLRAQPYRSALQGTDGVVVLFLDITQRKNAELALRQSDRRKEEFLAVLAHELRNPLAPIAAGIEVLRKLPDDGGLVLRVVATMSRQTKQLVRLVDDLLEVGRINEGKLLLHREKVGIAEVVRDAIAALSPLIESLGHELTVELPSVSPVVDGDLARLTQMVGNLLHNAVRYTPPRGKLALRVRCEEAQVVISVQDNGRGIAAESLPNIFEMFYQERQGEGGGTGLGIGLTLAKKLVELHGGSITAESAGLNQGSTFCLRLPLAKPDQQTGPAPATQNNREAVDHHRVLIVDDNADAAETLRLLMKSMGGNEVRTASSGPEALKAAAQLHPDIVLLDLSMPGMDGFEVARRMRAEPWGRGALLVALTGWGQEQHRRRSIEAGFDRHMTKPADVETLRAVLQT